MCRPLKETLTVEFKSDRKVLPMEELYEAVVAMANTEGGTVYLGIEDDGTVTGLHAQHFNIAEMAAKITTHTIPAMYPHLRLADYEEGRVLEIEVAMAHQLTMTSSGKYLRRRMKQDNTPEVIAMQPYEIMQRLSYIQAIDPSAQVIEEVTAKEAFSGLEHERLRNMIRIYHGDAVLLELPDSEIDSALGFVRYRNNIAYPTIAGLLMVGSEEYIRRFVPANEVLFQVLDGTDVLSNPPAMCASLLQIFEKTDLLFQSRVTEQELQIGLFRVPIPNYEKDAFREAFVNALVHRDYFRMGAVLVQLRCGTMIISSPGGFPEGVTPQNILTAAPTPRNKTLAEAAKRIGLAERTGRGVDKIYTAMLRNGHDFPDYGSSNSVSVILKLNSAELDEAYVRMLVNEERRLGKSVPLDALIVLSSLKNKRRCTLEQLAADIQQSEEIAGKTVEWLIELGMVERIGNGIASRYILSSKVYAMSGNEVGFTRQKGLNTIQEKEMILAHIDNFGSIRRAGVVDLCKCNNDHATWLLNEMKKSGTIELCGSGRGAFYKRK